MTAGGRLGNAPAGTSAGTGFPAYRPGSSYSTAVTRDSNQQRDFGQNNLIAVPFPVWSEGTMISLQTKVVTAGAAGTVARLGVYADSGQMAPGDLLVDAGTVNTDSTGTKSAPISLPVQPGLYWIAQAMQQWVSGLVPALSYEAAAGTPSQWLPQFWGNWGNRGMRMTGVSGPLPATFVLDGAVVPDTPLLFVGF